MAIIFTFKTDDATEDNGKDDGKKDKAKVTNPRWGGTVKTAVEPAGDDLINRRHASFLL
jgi:hypothetical protein